MRIVVAAGPDGGGALQPFAEDGTPAGPAETVPDLAAAVGARERADAPRWVWSSTARLYPRLLRAGVRVARCHDLELVESLLLGHAGRYGEPRSVRAAWARLRGEPVPADRVPADPAPQPSLFDSDPGSEPGAGPGSADPSGDGEDLDRITAVHAEQRRVIAGLDGFALLAAAESAGALVAAELTHHGLPWSAARHDALLTELLGPRPSGGLRPRRLQDLADRIGAAFGPRNHVNPDSPAQILKAFAAAGLPVPSTRAHVLKRLDHPAVPLLLEYKELARLHTAHGWSWLDTWVHEGRFRPEYVVGGVVSGRWATNGGGALQIPRVLRTAVVADPGWVLVVADAAQLEPRVLAALAGDRAFAAAAAHGDLYEALSDAFRADVPSSGGARTGATRAGGARTGELTARDKAKLALLSAMYGGGTGEAVQLLAVLRNRFPDAFGFVEAAARAGERGHLVRSRLGRTCPPPSAGWRELTSAGDDDRAVPDGTGQGTGQGTAAQALRSRGRFTRNFVVQATAADWALALLGELRRRLTALGPPHLVFFQHDEVIVHAPAGLAGEVTAAIHAAAAEAGRLLFGDTPVVFPMEIATVDCYADAK
ncbi:bifunctional 3'-5' exonuclease/DNA polymerase [Actinomadura xylanilytica]|uniref:bifunctional 3'-5' exonuclease/DNA polymerase n=1 Tax=Actinomadura xylanilytica TaxID=887459 RepID=UPI00255AEEF2|nr:bifunctional 3'-5' exonuclease/DNA polymerase [Actinomadura xylanilytica]MDL4774742.1 bifunctional 3'-5' exonuclease/DNA polymerase [Actinomadura xylanilytica]